MPTSEYVCRRNPHGSLHGAAARERAKVRGEGRQCANRASGHSHGCGRCAQQQRYKGRAPHVSQGEWRGDAPRKLRLENFSVSHYCPVTGQHMDPDTMSSSPASPVPVLPPAAVQGSKLADFALRDYHQVAAGRATRFRERRRARPTRFRERRRCARCIPCAKKTRARACKQRNGLLLDPDRARASPPSAAVCVAGPGAGTGNFVRGQPWGGGVGEVQAQRDQVAPYHSSPAPLLWCVQT